MDLEELRTRLVELNEEANALIATAKAEKRELSVEETNRLDQLLGNIDLTEANIERLEKLAEKNERLAAGRGRKTQPDQPAQLAEDDHGDVQVARPATRQPTTLTIGGDRIQHVPSKNGGFKNFGDFALSVVHACNKASPRIDPRLERLAAFSTGGTEGVGEDGGFAVPPDFRTAIMEKVLAEDSLLTRCDQHTTPSNSFTMVVDDTTPWQTSGGIQAVWLGETGSYTQSKPKIKDEKVKLHKIGALVPISEELAEDAPAIDAYLRRKAPAKIAFKINEAIIAGDGNAKPLGILNAPCTVSVAKESSQLAATIVGANINKMWNRLYGPNRANAVWLINQDVEPELDNLTLPGRDNTGAVATGWGAHVYLPPNGLSQSPFGTLKGRPVIPTQACKTLGAKGDIILADLTQFMALLKSGENPRTETSMHLWFDQDVLAFKFTLRVGGQPWWPTSITALNGSNTYSCFVTLDERA
jgi:HK97 family phage major capsid protein